MDLSDAARFPDDRSDSGVSSLRSSSASGDERSGSRSSAVSGGEEALLTPSPVRVWRDPALLLEAEPNVRHVHSVQHQTLLMSHHHPHSHHHALPPQPVPQASAAPLPAAADVLWKRYQPLAPPSHHSHHHMISHHAATAAHHAAQELERDRLLRERERDRERDRMEREKAAAAMERERQQQEILERERQEKQRAAEQAVHKHFEESLRLANQKRGDRSGIGWSLINSLPPPTHHHSQAVVPVNAVQRNSQRLPPPAHSRRPVHQPLKSTEPNVGLFNYHHAALYKSAIDPTGVNSNELKNSVIVKHGSHALETTKISPHSVSPKSSPYLRGTTRTSPPPALSVAVSSPISKSTSYGSSYPPSQQQQQQQQQQHQHHYARRLPVTPPPHHHTYGRSVRNDPSSMGGGKIALPPSVSPSPYQQVGQYHPPPQALPSNQLPPPAHSGRSSATVPPHLLKPGATNVNMAHAVQTHPLDLGISSSLRRTAEQPVLETKKRRVESPETTPVDLKPVSVAVSPAPSSPCVTPAPPPQATPPPLLVSADSDKSNSPGPARSSTATPLRHLKKAWLQRHTGGEAEEPTPLPPTRSPVPVVMPIVKTEIKTEVKTEPVRVNNDGRKAPAADTTVNGHLTDPIKTNDSSSSDQEQDQKAPPKRKPPKVKRKKGGGNTRKDKKKPTVSGSGSDSDKDTASDKDSDSGASVIQRKLAAKEAKKRGRRPKGAKRAPREEVAVRDPFRKPPLSQLKKTGESFLQDGACFEVAPKLAKCRECRWTPNQRSKNMPSNIFCRFYAFRRLRYTKNGQLAIAGFSDPHKDATEEDLRLWLPSTGKPPVDLDRKMARFLLRSVGDQFCDLLVQERDAHDEHMSDDKIVAWKRVVQGVREMCDVCETTLFNFHWACSKCGFVVCLDCYKGRKNGTIKVWGEASKERDEYSWLLCTNRQAHEQERLMLTQIIAGDSLNRLDREVHEARARWNVPQRCDCALARETVVNGNNDRAKCSDDADSPLSWLADVALKKEPDASHGSEASDSDEEHTGGGFSTLRELLVRPAPPSTTTTGGSGRKTSSPTPDEVISSVVADSLPAEEMRRMREMGVELKHYVRRYKWEERGREPLPARIMTLTESRDMYPDVPHSWLCEGRLLRLMDPVCVKNYRPFQEQWRRGQPVLVSGVDSALEMKLWQPESFGHDFGNDKADLINCSTGNLVPNQFMRRFWEGFAKPENRLRDEHGQPMLLKLKDWPPGEDFAELLPARYADLMRALPLGEYTRRTGRLNLAGRLPEFFVRPDLGPKMYTAYGSALTPAKGTTNLHLDVSDAVNVMVYVGVCDGTVDAALRAIDEAGCDAVTRRRVRESDALPGALWHIYHARDADKIRDLLNKAAIERGARLEPHHDPIHDQSCYLDSPLRERLRREYGVEGYAIVQCFGDAVFVPAGAPHQVRNLHDCIKVAEDFVSPENVSHCFHLTQEFRTLSDTHTNHEDKLQIKNIIYHAVKDSLSVLAANSESTT